jgi:TPP-dependent trihydroxycyclohexane-1,2-dione (THcHDO) dehydratase
MLARKYYQSLCPFGLLVPTNLQSMGFAIASAIGASLANPDRLVVVLIGDGGFQMTALELLVALRYRTNVLVLVLCDGHLGLIREKQITYDGYEYGVKLPELDIAGLCETLSLDYEDDFFSFFEKGVSVGRLAKPTVVAIRARDSKRTRKLAMTNRIKSNIKRRLGSRSLAGLQAVRRLISDS